MTAEIIKFSAAARSSKQQSVARTLTPREKMRAGKPELPPPATESAKNSRMRAERRDAWGDAHRLTRYWRARLDWQQALGCAQHWHVADSDSLPSARDEDRFKLVDSWRVAFAAQLLTPAPDAREIVWKRRVLLSREMKDLPVKADHVEYQIAEDEAFLAAHPTRRGPDPEKVAQRRAFKDAMRQRIREVAALRNLSEGAIKSALRLKHDAIGEFCKTNGVYLGWLLEGIGPMFKPWPVT